MPITVKKYKCPVCDFVNDVSTNHFGEIYSYCKCCGSDQPLQCVEPEAVRTYRPFIITTLHFYYLHLDIEQEEAEYDKLLDTLKDRKKFDALMLNPFRVFEKFKEFDGKEVHLYSDWITENQWASQEGLRIFDWQEAIYPNKKIKAGYYLDISEEMIELRRQMTEGVK